MPKPPKELNKKERVSIEVQHSVAVEYSLETIEAHIADLENHKANTEAEIIMWQGFKTAVTAKLEA